MSDNGGTNVSMRDRRESQQGGWTALLTATTLCPIVIGLVLLLPSIMGSALLGIPVIPHVPLSKQLILTHSTSSLPFLLSFQLMSRVAFSRLWIGFSCFLCAVPSKNILDGAARENKDRRSSLPLRIMVGMVP
jgi:hypothetical protein